MDLKNFEKDYKEELFDLKERYNALKEEVEDLRMKLKYNDEDNSQITMKYEKTNKEKHSQVIDLEQKLKEDNKVNEQKVEQLKQFYGDKVMESEKEYLTEIKNLKLEIEKLNEMNRTISHYRENYDNYNRDLVLLKEENERLAQEIETKTKDLEERHLEETKKTKRAAINAIREVRVKALTEAFKRLETMDLMKYQENDKLLKDVMDLGEEINKVKSERDYYKELYSQSNNDYSILKNQIDILTKKNNESTKQLNLFKNMNERLETEIRKVLKSTDDNKADLQSTYSDKLSEKEVQLLSCQEDLRQKNTEVKDLRSIAQMILDQRSDIEIFFLEALEKVKLEIKRRKIEDKEKTKLPIIKNKVKSTQFSLVTEDPYASRMKKLEEEKIDIRDLTFEEKEKVLRFLFIKMNKGVAPTYWREVQEDNVEEDIGQDYKRESMNADAIEQQNYDRDGNRINNRDRERDRGDDMEDNENYDDYDDNDDDTL